MAQNEARIPEEDALDHVPGLALCRTLLPK
jgi:hypothetical protein